MRLGRLRQGVGEVWCGGAWRGEVWLGLQTAARRVNPPCCSLWEQIWPGSLRHGTTRLGAVGPGKARYGMGHRRWHGGFSLPAILIGVVTALLGVTG